MKRLFLFALLLPALALAIYDIKWFNVNHWSAPFENFGPWSYDPQVSPGGPGGSWPQPLHNYYVFGAGPWFGAIVPSSSPETLCTFMYNPNSGGTEACPALSRYWRQGYGDSLDRVYRYPGDWPPPLSRFPMAPQDPRSDMDLWCCFSDSDPSQHIEPGHPLGIDVYLTVHGFSDSLAEDFFFLKYELANCRGESITDAYFGPCVDPDIGDAADDVTGLILDTVFVVGDDSIRVRNVGIVFDYDNYEPPNPNWDSGAPGAVLFMLLAGPDSLGLTALKRFSIDIDPVTDPAQYLTLAGYDYRTGEYKPYDTGYVGPADVRMLLSTGPFDLPPKATVTFWYAIIGTPYDDTGACLSARDPSNLALRCKWALYYFGLLTGIEEGPPSAEVRTTNAATIVRGVLFLPSSLLSPPSSLFSLDGHRALDLRPGPNDVSHLSPGVYFVRQASGVERAASSVTKIVLTE